MNCNFDALVAEGQNLHRENRWREAIEHWRKIVGCFPDKAMPLAHLGFALIKMDDLIAAAICYQDLLEKHPTNPWGYIGQGLILEAHHRWPNAEQIYINVLQKFPEHPQVFLGLARALKKQGKISEAKNCLQNGIACNSLPVMRAMLESLNGIRKSDIINQLIQNYGLKSYFEYNKPRCELAINEVSCANKEIAYIPEYTFVGSNEEGLQADCLRASEAYSNQATLTSEQLLTHFDGQYFDIIFFDPAHIRPAVDQTLKILPQLLKRDGFLVVHDCNPRDIKLVGTVARSGAWCGETYKAFANFYLHNSDRAITIDEDFGVSIILNRDLNLDYSEQFDINYDIFSKNREKFNGLISHEDFKLRLMGKSPLQIFK